MPILLPPRIRLLITRSLIALVTLVLLIAMLTVRDFKFLDRIVFAIRILVFHMAGPFKVGPKLASWTRSFRARVDADPAGKPGSNNDRFTVAIDEIHLDDPFLYLHSSDPMPVHLDIEPRAAH